MRDPPRSEMLQDDQVVRVERRQGLAHGFARPPREDPLDLIERDRVFSLESTR